MDTKLLIFTDLDGTLLDFETYSFNAAMPSLELIREMGIPLILCSSKTRAEIEMYRKVLGNNDPFISENGGGIFIPENYFPHYFKYDKTTDGYKVIEFGSPYIELIEALNSIKIDSNIKLKGFSNMSIPEVSSTTGLDVKLAKLSKMREYDEPFLIFGNKKDCEYIKAEIIRRGFNYTKGGRFHHITGKNDKGGAVKVLIRLFKEKAPELTTVGLGDSLNDLPMLEAVDKGFLIKKCDRIHDPRIMLENLTLSDGIGPIGWNHSILDLLSSYN